MATDEAAPKPPPPPTISQLGSKVSKLLPTPSIRSAGANQLGRKVFSHRFDSEHEPVHLVIRKHQPLGRRHRDAALRARGCPLAHGGTQEELYVELEARLQAIIELPVEIELQPPLS